MKNHCNIGNRLFWRSWHEIFRVLLRRTFMYALTAVGPVLKFRANLIQNNSIQS